MADQASAVQPQVALIFGDAEAVQHVRTALAGHMTIVYDAQAAAFDAEKLVASGARAALVNLDSYDWLDTLTAQLSKAGVAAVFNDPEISSQLDGWERARWLRHLVAKLRGSDDFDPPRPASGVEHEAAPAASAPADESAAPLVAVPPAAPAPIAESVAPLIAAPAAPALAAVADEKPLSPHEIESMTADFSNVTAEPATPHVEVPVAPTPPPTSPNEPAMGLTFDAPSTGDALPADNAAGAEPPHLVTAPSAADDFDSALDVDTEALSAMIDARLAAPESHVQPVIAEDLSAPDMAPPVASVAEPVAPVAEVATAVMPAPISAQPPHDDADVLGDLPALGDWELVDPEAPMAAAPKPAQHGESTLTDSLAGIELVPMEDDVPLELHTGPIEHRLYVEKQKATDAANDKTADSANGDHA